MKSDQLLAHFDRISKAPDAIPRIQNFILNLAMRGKLVEQKPQIETVDKDYINEPISVLFPFSWRLLNFGMFCDIQGGNQPPKSQFTDDPRPGYAFTPKFAFLVLKSNFFQKKLTGATRSAQAGFNKGDLSAIDFPLPPLAEQHRIVAKVDELMALCDRLEAAQAERESRRDRLTRASFHWLNQSADAQAFRDHARFTIDHLPRLTTRAEHIKQLRQTILNLAVRGRLEPQDPDDEPSSSLLGNRQVNLTFAEAPWQLPKGWVWSTLDRIGEVFGGGTPNKSDSSFWNGTIPWVSPKDMKIDVIDDAQDHISEEAIASSSTRSIPAGAILMVVRGMILAHSFPTAITTVRVTINQDMKGIVPFCPEMAPMLLLVTKGLKPEVLRMVKRSTHGTCKLLTEELFNLPVPIPPLAEQHRIVAKVDELMALCDRLESQLATAHTESRRLLEAVLHKALEPVA